MKIISICVVVLLPLTACNSVVTDDAVTSRPSLSDVGSSGGHKGNARPKVKLSDSKLGQITGVDIEHLFALLGDKQVLLVDCRPSLYYRMGHIDGAINLPYRKYAAHSEKFVEQLDEGLAEQKVIVLYCQNYSCPDAYLFAKKVAEIGYSTSVYKGGWQEWKGSGL